MTEIHERITHAANAAITSAATTGHKSQAGYNIVAGNASNLGIAAAVAILEVLVKKAFPHDDVDYTYACEELAMDACEALRVLSGTSPTPTESR